MKRTIEIQIGDDARPLGAIHHNQQGAREILGRVEAAIARWREEGRTLGMTEDELDQFVEAFEHGERAEARKLST